MSGDHPGSVAARHVNFVSPQPTCLAGFQGRLYMFIGRRPFILNATFDADQMKSFGDYIELSMQSQYNKRDV